jgi:hypothetical protein
MSTGIMVWDEAGQLLIDTSTNVATLLGVETSRTSGFSITNDYFYKGVPWFFYLPRGVYSFGAPADGFPSVSFSGNMMTVTGSSFDGTFYYGIY